MMMQIHHMYRFWSASEDIYTQYFYTLHKNNFQNIIIVNGSIGQLKGKSLEIVDVNAATTWPSLIKTCWILNCWSKQGFKIPLTVTLSIYTKVMRAPHSFMINAGMCWRL